MLERILIRNHDRVANGDHGIQDGAKTNIVGDESLCRLAV